MPSSSFFLQLCPSFLPLPKSPPIIVSPPMAIAVATAIATYASAWEDTWLTGISGLTVMVTQLSPPSLAPLNFYPFIPSYQTHLILFYLLIYYLIFANNLDNQLN